MKKVPLPVLGLTMGDASGIGPEVLIKGLIDPKRPKGYVPLVLGDLSVLQERNELFNLGARFRPVDQIPQAEPQEGEIYVMQTGELDREGFKLGIPHKGAGDLAYKSILKAVEMAQQGKIHAMVTAPINKEALHLAGHHYDGHTGLIAQLCHCTDYRMTFATEKLKISHVTAHMSLKEAIEKIKTERILKTIQIGHDHLLQLGIAKPRIAVCGLNPHAGESGIFGMEDIEEITPAVQAAQAQGIDAVGPLPPDTTFMHAFNGRYDLVVAQYHDQGHIPGKLVAFDRGVNVTVGLPIIRTSVDHGTAFDIVEEGTAGHENLFCAIEYALTMVQGDMAAKAPTTN